MRHLIEHAQHVIVNAVKKKDKLRLIRDRWKTRSTHRWAMAFSLFPDSLFGAVKHYAEARLYPYNCGHMAMSRRLTRRLSRLGLRAATVLPPVGDQFFLNTQQKGTNAKWQVTYIGRLEAGKGIDSAHQIAAALQSDSRFLFNFETYAFDDSSAADMYEDALRELSNASVSRRPHRGWTPADDAALVQLLRKTDFLLLPYGSLSSSIDTPLLLLEGMASLCACIVPSLGDVPHLTGGSDFTLPPGAEFVRMAVERLRSASQTMIADERARLAHHVQRLQISARDTCDQVEKLLLQPRANR